MIWYVVIMLFYDMLRFIMCVCVLRCSVLYVVMVCCVWLHDVVCCCGLALFVVDLRCLMGSCCVTL